MQFTTEGYCYAEYQEREIQESSSGTMNICTKKAPWVNRMTRQQKRFLPQLDPLEGHKKPRLSCRNQLDFFNHTCGSEGLFLCKLLLHYVSLTTLILNPGFLFSCSVTSDLSESVMGMEK